MEVSVRPERDGEAVAVGELTEAAFGGSVEALIVDSIRGTDRWIDGGSLVAQDAAGDMCGHLLLSEGDLVAADGSARRIWMVGPVAVRPGQQRRGIGTLLMNAAIALATEREQPVLCLLGHSDYYPRFGFEPARRIGIQPPQPWRDENWLALRLPCWTADLAGIAHFPTAFGG